MHRLDSDIDLLVVLPQVDHKRNTAVAMLRLLRDVPIPVDVVPTDPEEIARRGQTGEALCCAEHCKTARPSMTEQSDDWQRQPGPDWCIIPSVCQVCLRSPTALLSPQELSSGVPKTGRIYPSPLRFTGP